MDPTHGSQISGRRQHLVALPFPGRGHLNPMLNLCRHLATRDLLVTVVVTEEWLGLLSSSSEPPPPPNLRLCSIPNVLPSESKRGASYGAFIQAVLTKMEAPVETLLAGLDEPPDAILADSLLPWAARIGQRRALPVAALFPQAAAVFLALHGLDEADTGRRPATEVLGKGSDFMNYIPRSLPTNPTDFLSDSSSQNIVKSFLRDISWSFTAQSLLFNSFHELESRVLDTLKSKLSVPIYPIGPAILHISLDKAPKDPYYFKWLDSQPSRSVLYVSLGSFLHLSGTQMDEIAMGLGASGHHFLWVTHAETEHVRGLNGETGLVVPWCDQLKVLSHPSVGGFLTHCGWSSVLEGLHAGVPMLTFPLMWDQYPNSKLIVDEWKVGFRLKKQEEGVVGREEIAHLVRKLMDLDEDENKELGRRLEDLKEKSWAALMEKGSSTTNLDAFVQGIVHCGQKISQESDSYCG